MFCLNFSSISSRLNKNIQLDKKIEQSFFTTSKHSTKSPTILFQTTVFGKTPRYRNECPFECVYTSNRSFFNKADAVVFHANDLRENKRLKVANNKQKFVFFSLEAPVALERLSQGTWWKNVLKFHWIMSYAKNSHIQMNYKNGQLLGYFKDLGNKFNAIGDFTLKSVLKGKKKRGAIWFVSNCWSQERMQVAEALKKHFHVDIGGQCGDNTLCSLGQNCSQLISQYYFYLAFENANCVDYVTEKLFNKLDLPIVPIVMKRSVYEKILPPEAFIAVDDFDSAKTLADFLTFLINNPRLYFEYFEVEK
ncbi:Glyco-tran-10-N domain-containing protein [Aphelenchoides bicaudatus]|nr:Glyco-tran-10-N domain-containing protein [Aphelenchoides bicaudatus]